MKHEKRLSRLFMIGARTAMVVAVTCAASAGATARAEMLLASQSAQMAPVDESVVPSPLAYSAPSLREVCSADAWRYVLAARIDRAPSEIESKAFHPAPEPSSLALAAMGVAGLLRLRKRGR